MNRLGGMACGLVAVSRRRAMGRPFFAPPGVPAERVHALRTAFVQALKDPAFLEEAEKQGVEVQLVTGEDIHKLLERIYAAPKQVVERARAAAE
jgi:tripartite-type tricarboxylate transporter receptor subunit TctC